MTGARRDRDRKPLFELGGAPAIEAMLAERVRARLSDRLRLDRAYPERWLQTLARRDGKLSLLEGVRLMLWHRQFHGDGVAGLPAAIGAGRRAYRLVKGLGLRLRGGSA